MMATQQSREKTVAFVLYSGLTPLDLVGPLQVFTSLNKFAPEFRPVVVAERIAPMESDIGVNMIAEKTFVEVQHPEIIIVPGGGMPTLRAMSNDAIRRYVRSASESAEVVASVCTGALILASVGLLEGRPGTTHWAFRQVLNSYGARYHPRRWVEDGKFITAAGVSAGIDMALHLVARLTDEEMMRKVQRDIEYDPQPPFGGIVWERMGLLPRTIRGGVSLLAPLMTRRPKQLTQRAGWS